MYKKRHKYSASLELLNILFDSMEKGVYASELFLNKKYDKSLSLDELRRSRDSYSKLIRRLNKDGLINREIKNKNLILKISSKGVDFMNTIKSKRSFIFPSFNYVIDPKNKSYNFVIVAFDVPEKFRNKRNWLRGALQYLDFKMVQKSFWIGKIKLPRQFLLDLKYIGLASYIEIFEVTKAGSLVKAG